MVKHGALSRSHVYQMLASKDARVRRAAFALLEASNPALRRNSELYIDIIRFIWDANPSYDVYREFSQRHLLVGYKVHELIGAVFRWKSGSSRVPPPLGAPTMHADIRAVFSADCFGRYGPGGPQRRTFPPPAAAQAARD
jgi:hypothetical protein